MTLSRQEMKYPQEKLKTLSESLEFHTDALKALVRELAPLEALRAVLENDSKSNPQTHAAHSILKRACQAREDLTVTAVALIQVQKDLLEVAHACQLPRKN